MMKNLWCFISEILCHDYGHSSQDSRPQKDGQDYAQGFAMLQSANYGQERWPTLQNYGTANFTSRRQSSLSFHLRFFVLRKMDEKMMINLRPTTSEFLCQEDGRGFAANKPVRVNHLYGQGL